MYLFRVSYQICSFFQHLHSIPPLCTPTDALCCRKDHSSYQKSKNHLMVCPRAWSLPNSLEISGDICHASMKQTDMSTEIFWSKAIKRQIQVQHRQIISAEPGVHSGHSSSSGTSQPCQVRYRFMLTTIPIFSL